MNTSAGTRKKRNLKTLIIEPFKQMKLGVYVLALALAFVSLTAWVFLNAFSEQYKHVMEIFQVVDPNFQWELVTNDVFYTNVIRLGVLLVSFVVLLFAVVFRVTHKYYGPLVSIERFVESMANGDYSQRVIIRRGDELQELANRLNLMAENLESRHGTQKNESASSYSSTKTKSDRVAG